MVIIELSNNFYEFYVLIAVLHDIKTKIYVFLSLDLV